MLAADVCGPTKCSLTYFSRTLSCMMIEVRRFISKNASASTNRSPGMRLRLISCAVKPVSRRGGRDLSGLASRTSDVRLVKTFSASVGMSSSLFEDRSSCCRAASPAKERPLKRLSRPCDR